MDERYWLAVNETREVIMIAELQILQNNLAIVKKALDDLEQLNVVTINFIRRSKIRDIYHRLRGHNIRTTASHVVVHTDNIASELDALKRTLQRIEAILLQQAEQYGKKPKASR